MRKTKLNKTVSELVLNTLPPNTRAIGLGHGRYVIVDEEDYAELSQYNWSSGIETNSKNYPKRYRLNSDDPSLPLIIKMARQIMGFPDSDVDHINGVTEDCRRSNLRVCTRAENLRNQGGVGKSGYKGVYWSNQRNKWVATLTINGKWHWGGAFKDVKEAAKAANELIKKHHGEFACLNKIDE